jgi:hypothetical protein
VADALRKQEGCKVKPSMMILDCQSVKSAEGGEEIAFDGGKKGDGRKCVMLNEIKIIKISTKMFNWVKNS